MNRETQSIEKKRHIPLWNTKKVVKKDILLIPAYIFFQSIIPIIVVFGTLGITAMITQHAPPAWFYNLSLSISFVLAQGLVLMLFFALHKFYIASVASRQFKNAKKYVRQILIVVMITFVLMLLIEWFVQWLPASLRFSATQYERRVEGLFLHPFIGYMNATSISTASRSCSPLNRNMMSFCNLFNMFTETIMCNTCSIHHDNKRAIT